MASTANNFGLLSNARDPAEDIAQASNAAKNRKKKEKRKAKKEGAVPEAVPQAVEETVPKLVTKAPQNGSGFSFHQARKAWLRDATAADCWSSWDEWTREARLGKKSASYNDGHGKQLSFRDALLLSGAVSVSLARSIESPLQPSDKEQMANLLAACLPTHAAAGADIAGAIVEISCLLGNASSETKETARKSLEFIVRAFVTEAQSSSSSTAGSETLANNLDKEIDTKKGIVVQALSQLDTVQVGSIDTSMSLVMLLKRKFDAQCGVSEPATTTLSAATAAEVHNLVTLLDWQLAGPPAGAKAGAAAPKSRGPALSREASLIDANIARLSSRISSLESDLRAAKSELSAAQTRRAALGAAAGKAAAPTQNGTASHSVAKGVVERLQAQVAAAGGRVVASGGAGESEETLVQLMENCRRCAQMHDKYMEKLTEKVEFARSRFTSAVNLKDEAKVKGASDMFAGVRAESARTHDAMVRLEQLVSSLEANMNSSQSFSTLRPVAMQVKQITWKVYAAHNSIVANGHPDVTVHQTQPGRGLTMEEILSMDVKGSGKGGKGRQATTATTSVPAPGVEHQAPDPSAATAATASTFSSARAGPVPMMHPPPAHDVPCTNGVMPSVPLQPHPAHLLGIPVHPGVQMAPTQYGVAPVATVVAGVAIPPQQVPMVSHPVPMAPVPGYLTTMQPTLQAHPEQQVPNPGTPPTSNANNPALAAAESAAARLSMAFSTAAQGTGGRATQGGGARGRGAGARGKGRAMRSARV